MGTGGPADEELRKLREGLDALRALADALDGDDLAGGRSVVAKVVNGGAMPTAGAVLMTFRLQPHDPGGVETEGAGGTLTSRPGNFPAANLLAGLPPVGTAVVASEVGGAWVFSYA